MFERMAVLTPDRNSVLESGLRALLDGAVFELAPGFTGRRPVPPPVDECIAGAAQLERLLDEGAVQLGRALGAHREAARVAADQAEALAAFARSRPASLDRPDAEVGAAAARTRAARPAALTPVSEWAVDEVAVALQLSSSAATKLLVESVLLVERLPATLDALREGRLSWRHVQVMTDLVARLSDGLRPVAEERLLARIDGKTCSQLRVAARRVVQRLDAEALAQRVVEAIRDRRISVYPGDDGMATLSAVLPAPVARAVQDALRQYAEAAAMEGDERTLGQRMVDCLVDLVLRPGEHGMAPVQARLTVVAAVETLLGSDEPGEVDGDLVPAELVRQLAASLGLMGEREASGQRTGSGEPAPEADERVESLSSLLRTHRLQGTALGHRPHIALVDELSGQLLALSDAIGLRRGLGLGPPAESPGYRPEAELDRFVRLRDRRCRFPGCRARPARCDLDHTVPWPWGPTSSDNLCCLCRHHHRLGHQAPGWRLRGLADGGLEWTTPGGIVATTHPPRFGADDDLLRSGAAAPGAGVAMGPPPGGADPPPADVWLDEPPF
ncbi:MAG TPA: DUF222 domain-containing protein [Modestobacter sp.]|nr:DUF222 domain-containing protein [Modestobacter sp.]